MSMRRRARSIAATAITLMTILGAIGGPAAADPHDVVVGPGDNVEAALGAALPGTTVKLKPGTYHQFLVMPAGVTLEGSGTGAVGGTVLAWPSTGASPCSFGLNTLVCMTDQDRVSELRVDITGSPTAVPAFGIGTRGSPNGATAERVVAVGNPADDGIFLGGSNATIRDTETSGFREAILLSAIGGEVKDNVGHGNCSGVVVFDAAVAIGATGQASNVSVEGNREQGPQPCPAGIGIDMIGAPHSTVRDNTISGFNFEAVSADAVYDTIDGNTIRDTCLGINVLDDTVPAPDGPADHDVVRGNEVTGSPAAGCYVFSPGGTFASGIRLDGTTNATVAGNEVNVSLPPAAGPVDGILVDGAPTFFNPATPAPQNVTVTGNEAHEALNGSLGYDIGWDGKGTNISFALNECTSSNPSGLCAGR